MRAGRVLFVVVLCILTTGAFCQSTSLPVDGKGVLIFSIRSRNWHKESPRFDDYEWGAEYQVDTASTTALGNSPIVPGIGAPEGQRPNHLACYSLDQILRFIQGEGTQWIAVKASNKDNTTVSLQFDEELVRKCEDNHLKLLAWTGLNGAELGEGRDQQAVNAICRTEADTAAAAVKMGVDGVIVFPDTKTCYKYKAMAEGGGAAAFAQELIDKLPTGTFVGLAPVLKHGDGVNPSRMKKIDIALKEKFRAAKATKNIDFAVMPRVFWKGGYKEQNFDDCMKKLRAGWAKDAAYGGENPLKDKLIPIGQCEKTTPTKVNAHGRRKKDDWDRSYLAMLCQELETGTHSRNFHRSKSFHHSNKRRKDPPYAARGLGVFVFDCFLPQDHIQYKDIAPSFNTAKAPISIQGGKRP